MESAIAVELSSGNLWADLGRPDAETALARAELMRRAADILHARGDEATGVAAAGAWVDHAAAADLMRGRMSRFSLERLIAFLNALDRDVEITVRRRPADSNRPARVVVLDD